MSQYVKPVTAAEWEELMKGDKPVVCDFWATWCAPCRMLAPVLDGIADKLQDKAVFVKADVDQEESLAAKYRVYSIPCVKIFRGGEEVGESVGFLPEEELTKIIESYL